MEISQAQQSSSHFLPFARSYQIEALEKAIKRNTIVFLETGSGKTLIAIMLLCNYAYLLRKPSPYIAVFLVPAVVLVTQQAEAIKMHTDLIVGKYWGEMGVDYWDAATWKGQLEKHEVLVMTPAILLDALRRAFIKLDMIKVLIFDECHKARGRHPYASIMKEFYHRQSRNHGLPRIFGMTASPVTTKGSSAGSDYWKHIRELENLMNSKVYTCDSEAVLAQYIPFPNAKIKFYEPTSIPYPCRVHVVGDLEKLRKEHMFSILNLGLEKSIEDSLRKKVAKLASTFLYCLEELGLWLAMKAAESMYTQENDTFYWEKSDLSGQATVKGFCRDVLKAFSTHVPFEWSICDNMKADVEFGFVTSKVCALVESLLQYRNVKDLRCIVFVERVVTAIVLHAALSELLPKLIGWNSEYIAGNQSRLQSQSRKEQNKIVEQFRRGTANVIVATSILEEGLDVQSCNLVIRFDPSGNVCSFIQSRGRARMQNSDFVLMVQSGDASQLARVRNYLSCGDIMRKESLVHASLPCEPIDFDEFEKEIYLVERTGAVLTLSSSVSLIYFYCARLPSDGYFKPSPRCTIDEDSNTCTIQFPNNCPLRSVTIQGNGKILKQLACFEACKQLHQMGALTDSLVPDIVVEENLAQELEYEPYDDYQASYVPAELISQGQKGPSTSYHCYVIELKKNFSHGVPVHDIALLVEKKLDIDLECMEFDMEVDLGKISMCMKYRGMVALSRQQVLLCRRFQVSVLRVLLDHDFNKLMEALKALDKMGLSEDRPIYDYILLPCQSTIVDWAAVISLSFVHDNVQDSPTKCPRSKDCPRRCVQMKSGLICSCKLENCLVYTPHSGYIYCVSGFLNDLNGNSLLNLKDGGFLTYREYYKTRHGLDLHFGNQPLLSGRKIFRLYNHLHRSRQKKDKESSDATVELPPELCSIIIYPFSTTTLYTFSFVPSIMHRVESLLLSDNLRKTHADHCMQSVVIPTAKVLEAITTKKCQEKFHLESLETLGDSFLKYAVSQQLFKTYQSHHEGLLSVKKDKIISNAALCKLACKRNIPGFIRNEPFVPKEWIIPGNPFKHDTFEQEFLSNTRKIYSRGERRLKSKTVADVVEALIGVFLSTGGEAAAFSFLSWLGVEVGFSNIPYQQNFSVCADRHVNIVRLQSLLNYTFRDPSLLVEALTHGSFMLPEIPRCYQRLEFLGDAVLDHLITLHLYFKYPGMTPGLLTDLRSASVNNDCYAISAVKAGLHQHVLYASQELHRQVVDAVCSFDQLSLESTFGWESEINFPKVLADIIESLAGAIFVDSNYNKDLVFQSIRPLLEPLITPETVKLHPIKELDELCQKHHFDKRKPIVSHENGVASITFEVEANGVVYKHTCTASDKKTAKKVASKAILKCLRESIPGI